MPTVQITWQRTEEYVHTVNTGELRELVSQLPGSEAGHARDALDRIDAGEPWQYDDRAIAYILSNTETGRAWVGALGDDNPECVSATGAPEITELRVKD